MANLIRSRGWGQVKPPVGSQIDRGHPLADGLVLASLQDASLIDLVTGTPPSAKGTDKWSPLGSLNATSTTVNYTAWQTPAIAMIGATASLTLVAFCVWNGSAIDFGGALTYTDGAGGNNGARSIQGAGDGTFGGFAYNDNTGLAAPVSGVPFMQAGHGSGTSWVTDRWQVGQSITASTTASDVQSPTTSSPQIKVHAERSSAQSFPGHVLTVYAWHRNLRLGELEWLAAEPYAFIAPPGPKILYIGFATPSGTTVTGSAAITGTGTVSATGVRKRSGAAAVSGTGAISASGVRTRSGAAAVSGSGTVSASGTVTRSGAAAITGTGTVTIAGVRTVLAAAALTGNGTIAAAGARTVAGAAGITGTGIISATSALALPACVVLTVSEPYVCTLTVSEPYTVDLSIEEC